MITYWRDGTVRITHEPTGVTATCDESRSVHRNKQHAMAMLRGKLWSLQQGGYPAVREQLVRSYTDADFDRLDIVDMPRDGEAR